MPVNLQKTIAEYRLWREKAIGVTLQTGYIPNPEAVSPGVERAWKFAFSLGLGTFLMYALLGFYQSPTASHWVWWVVVGFISLYWLRPCAYLAATPLEYRCRIKTHCLGITDLAA